MEDVPNPSRLSVALQPLQRVWAGLAERERLGLTAAAWLVGLFLLWTLALQPAWRTVREAPARLDALDRQWQTMQLLAADARELRALPPVPRAQASAALRAATERLGEGAKVLEQGDRAVLTLNAASSQRLREWLAEVRSTARAHAVELNLTRSELGLSGTVVVVLAPGAPS
jgi:general secretion pathway protein M